jgi:hypothetical protein
MSNDFENQNRQPTDDLLEGLLSLGEEYQSSDFPNPEREGCPDHGALVKAVRSRRLLDESLREHILVCSPCFSEFKALKEQSKNPSFPKVMVAGIGALVVVTLSLAGVFLLSSSEPDEPRAIAKIEVDERPYPGSSDIEKTLLDPDTTVNDSGTSSRPITKKKSYRFDAASNTTERGGNSSVPRQSLRSEKVDISITLPMGSPSGVYRISLLDEFGRTLSSEINTRSDGVRVTVSINLAGLQGPARLCVGAGDEVPECFPVIIQ